MPQTPDLLDRLPSIAEARRWLSAMGRLVPPHDRAILLAPPALVAKFVHYALNPKEHDGSADDLDARDPELVKRMLDLFRFVGRSYFRLRVEGVHHVPESGPALLVGNHNGGLVPTDSFFTALGVADRFGPERRLYGLAHDFLFHDETLRRYALRLGMLRASHDGARRALQAGALVLVYPGSDLDAFRPFRDRHRIVLGGRKGFLRVAIEQRVPIVPVVSVGTHEQLIVISRGDRVARLLHLHKWARTDVCPLAWAMPWGFVVPFVPYVPLPAQTTVAFGEPLTWPDVPPSAAHDDAVLERCYRDVERRMQAMLDRLSEGRRFLLGRPV